MLFQSPSWSRGSSKGAGGQQGSAPAASHPENASNPVSPCSDFILRHRYALGPDPPSAPREALPARCRLCSCPPSREHSRRLISNMETNSVGPTPRSPAGRILEPSHMNPVASHQVLARPHSGEQLNVRLCRSSCLLTQKSHLGPAFPIRWPPYLGLTGTPPIPQALSSVVSL